MVEKTIQKDITHSIIVSENEKDLIDVVRSTKCAHIDVYVQDFVPLRVERIREGILLGNKKNN